MTGKEALEYLDKRTLTVCKDGKVIHEQEVEVIEKDLELLEKYRNLFHQDTTSGRNCQSAELITNQEQQPQITHSCIICEKTIDNNNLVCDECKEAIEKLKSIISTNEKMCRRFDTDDEQF